MASPAWQVSGQYYETCSCDFIWPCLAGGYAAEPLQLSNTGHPAADSFSLARAARSRVQALGLAWDDASGSNNGQYAPFSWRSA